MNTTSNLDKPRTTIFNVRPQYDYVIKCWYNEEGNGRPAGYRYWTGARFVATLTDEVLRIRCRIQAYRSFATVIDNELDKVVKVRRK